MRRLMPWILLTSGGACLLAIVAAVLWIWLPRWAPEWVVKHSPWVDPVLRAMAGSGSGDALPMHLDAAFNQRIERWGSSATPSFIAGLESADARYRMMSVVSFIDWAPSRSRLSEEAQSRIVTLALTDDHLGVRMYAFFALGTERSPLLSEARVQGMKDVAPEVRRAVVAGLDSNNSEQDWRMLLSGLSDSHSLVRYGAIRRVRELSEVRAVPRLLEMAREEEDELFRQVLWALGGLKATEAIPLLRSFLIDREFNGHVEAIFRVLTQINPEDGFRAKVESLQCNQMELRAYSAWEFGAVGDSSAIEPLIGQLQDPEPLVFGHVVLALCQLKAVSAVEPILDLLETRGGELMRFEREQEVTVAIVSGHLLNVYFHEVIDKVAEMPLSPAQRERLDRLREE